MSISPGFIEELRSKVSAAQVIGRKVSWDSKKSKPAKGEFWANCPFHNEKTPSFKVDDKKGFYYCFGCNEKGDVLKFVQKTRQPELSRSRGAPCG